MAIYHCSIKIISRGKSQSAVAAAAYRAGEKIYNEYDGRTSDYTRKKGIAHTDVMLPDNAPAEYKDRAVLWNAVEQVEKAKNSQLAREIQIALPVELSELQNIYLVREYVKNNFVEHGMCADIAIHDDKTGNPHAHIMLTMRPFHEDRATDKTTDKIWGDKQKKVYNLDKDGNKIYDPKKRQYNCSKIQTTDWNEQNKAEDWRADWADIQNRYLEKHGFDVRVDHRSNERQGKEEIPSIHLGVAAHQMEQRGIRTERGDINRAIEKANEEIRNINATILKLESELQQLINEQQQEQTQQKQDIASTDITTATQKTIKADTAKSHSVKKPTAPTTTQSTPQAKPKSVQNPKTETPTKPIQPQKATTKSKPLQKPKTLKQVDKEIDIVETKLQRLDFADQVLMSFDHRIQDTQRNLSSAGFFERRKMQKEIAVTEQQRNSYQADTAKKYGTRPQLENQKSKLLAEKERIENATGVTAAHEREMQRQRNEAIQRQQERDRYNAERKAQRLANPSKDKNEPSR